MKKKGGAGKVTPAGRGGSRAQSERVRGVPWSERGQCRLRAGARARDPAGRAGAGHTRRGGSHTHGGSGADGGGRSQVRAATPARGARGPSR